MRKSLCLLGAIYRNISAMPALRDIIEKIRRTSPAERDKGTAFEQLIKFYLKNDPKYAFKDVWTWRDWARQQGKDARDTGIDLVAGE